MRVASWVSWKVNRILGEADGPGLLQKYLIKSNEERQAAAEAMEGEFPKLFFEHRGRTIDKWIHYLPIYERYMKKYKNTPLKMLEIGVFKGGSLELWRNYFGGQATIFGIDIDPACAERVDPPNQVRIGSQDDPRFLKSVIDEMGRPDVILDDGSHVGRHQRKTFDVLFPELKIGGLYIIEDLQTAYWRQSWEGGYKRPGTAIEYIKTMIDDLHAWYHDKPTTTPAQSEIGAIHIHDSMVVIEKTRKSEPRHVRVGN